MVFNSERIDDEEVIRNSEYLAKLDSAFEQLYSGKGQEHELIEEGELINA